MIAEEDQREKRKTFLAPFRLLVTKWKLLWNVGRVRLFLPIVGLTSNLGS